MKPLSPATSAVLANLRAAAEGHVIPTGPEWRVVYLDNARGQMSVRAFNGHLSKLKSAGFYKVIDGYAWGEVLMRNPLP